jgi:hypothetical protein
MPSAYSLPTTSLSSHALFLLQAAGRDQPFRQQQHEVDAIGVARNHRQEELVQAVLRNRHQEELVLPPTSTPLHMDPNSDVDREKWILEQSFDVYFIQLASLRLCSLLPSSPPPPSYAALLTCFFAVGGWGGEERVPAWLNCLFV